jgi:hypothetical protein
MPQAWKNLLLRHRQLAAVATERMSHKLHVGGVFAPGRSAPSKKMAALYGAAIRVAV